MKIPSDAITSKIISEMAKSEIQYLDVLNKMNLDPDDLEKVFKYMALSISLVSIANRQAIVKY